MTEYINSANNLATLLAQSNGHQVVFADLPPYFIPENEQQAYAIQREILSKRSVGIGGWKVGAQSKDAPIRYSPLPEDCVHKSSTTIAHDAFARTGLELEIAFCFGRSFLPSDKPYSHEEIWAGVNYIAAAIELVSSRFKEWPDVDRLAQLADLQNHGALVVGAFAPYRERYPFVAPKLSFTFDGISVVNKPPSNPAGDPRRLLPWLVNQCILRGTKIKQGTVVTTGSYTGMYFPDQPGTAIGLIDGIPPVRLTLK